MSIHPIRVAIIEDDCTTREGLRMLIDGSPGYGWAAAFGSVKDALCSTDPAAVVLLHINLPGMSVCDGVRVWTTSMPRRRA